MEQPTERFVHDLVNKIPALRRLLDEHVSDNDALLPHVFMGDLTRFVVQSYKGGYQQESPENDIGDLPCILSHLEQGMMSRNKEVQELVAVSFLENLDESDKSLRDLESMLGPALANELSKLRQV